MAADRARMKRLVAFAAGGLGLAVAGAALSLALYARALPPLDLSAVAARSTLVVDRDGRLLRPFVSPAGRWTLPVTHGDVDPRYLSMLKAFEDRRFDRHAGVDPLAVLRAAGQMAVNGRIVSGGSTLTMQVARLVEPRAERSFLAKLRQAVRAVELERRLTKGEILDLYLTLAPFGGNLEGVRAASLAYFGKEPKRLSTAEAALLVALPQSPEARRPDRAPAAARIARDRVLASARAAGLLTEPELEAATAAAVPDGRLPFPAHAPHAAEAALRERPGLALHRLTIDGRMQRALELLARERVVGQNAALSVAILAVDNETGEIRAHVGGVDHLSTERAGSLDLTRALRSPGSALKPFIYALAFENGIAHPETVLEDRPTRFGLYVPENFDLAFQGTVTARKALQMSLNIPAVDLLAALGPQRFLARLKGAGAALAMPRAGSGPAFGDDAPGLAVGLGGLGLTLHDLTRLYVGLARGGDTVDLRIRAGSEAGPPLRLVDPVPAWYVADILLGAPPPANALPGRIAYKTGTSYGYRDAFAVGFDRRHTIGVWVGRADNAAVPGLVGRLVAAPILFDAFARIGGDARPFPRPDGALAATPATLPPPLRHLRQDVPKTAGAVAQPALRLAFPPDGARIDLASGGDAGAAQDLALKVSGGVAPFTFLVDGMPVLGPVPRRQALWRPGGPGFLRISVIDAAGATDSVSVRVQ